MKEKIPSLNSITWNDFSKIEMRVGIIVSAKEFGKAIKPAYKLKINFGDYGTKNSSAQITQNYTCRDLVGKQIIAVVNFPPKQIADFLSECLVLGVMDKKEGVTLIQPARTVPNGTIIG